MGKSENKNYYNRCEKIRHNFLLGRGNLKGRQFSLSQLFHCGKEAQQMWEITHNFPSLGLE